MADPILDAAIEALIAEFTRSGVRELHVRSGSFELYLSTDPQARLVTQQTAALPSRTAAPPLPATPASAASLQSLPDGAIIVAAPNLGTFYGAPKPGAKAYVEVGSLVAPETELCLIEVMKLFTTVRAGHVGRVHAILAADGQMVEAGQPLFALVAA